MRTYGSGSPMEMDQWIEGLTQPMGGGRLKLPSREATAEAVSFIQADGRPREELVVQLQRGDLAAFEMVFRHESTRLSRYIANYMRRPEAIEEVFQDVWIEVWLHRGRIRKPQYFLSWLYCIARRRIALYYRKNNRQMKLLLFGDSQRHEEATSTMKDHRPGPDQMAKLRQWQSQFDLELNTLDLVSQEIISYRFGAGLTLKEIAEALDIPLQTVNTKLRRSLVKIRKSLEKKGIDYPF